MLWLIWLQLCPPNDVLQTVLRHKRLPTPLNTAVHACLQGCAWSSLPTMLGVCMQGSGGRGCDQDSACQVKKERHFLKKAIWCNLVSHKLTTILQAG